MRKYFKILIPTPNIVFEFIGENIIQAHKPLINLYSIDLKYFRALKIKSIENNISEEEKEILSFLSTEKVKFVSEEDALRMINNGWGTQGISGMAGPTGTCGTPGSQGWGTQGISGMAGTTGTCGTPGSQGSCGSPGSQGIIGATGIQGTTGICVPRTSSFTFI